MEPSELEKFIAKIWVQCWDQHIGLDGATAVIRELKAAGYKIIPPMTAEDLARLKNRAKELKLGA